MASLIVLFLLHISTDLSWNYMLDLNTSHIYSYTETKDLVMFGYSLAFLNDSILIGAPKLDTSHIVQEIKDSGGVFSCKTDDDMGCRLITVDPRGNNIATAVYNYAAVENKSNQWLGASIDTEPGTGFISVCAPFYIYKGPAANKREPVGQCYYTTNMASDRLQFASTSPCKTDLLAFFNEYRNAMNDSFASYHKTGHGMCGFSVSVGPNNELAIGSVGSYYWQGKLYSIIERENVSTGVRELADDDSYMTWDMKYGEFDNNNLTKEYAVSAPRADMLRGRVMIWSRRPTGFIPIYNITGSQAGSYFGYSVVVGHFNDDKLDDIAVGAPFFADFSSDIPELGRVTVFYQRSGAKELFRNNTLLTGTTAFGRFGLSMANVGDLNLDGFDELIVGAPYGGPNGNGVVFLYHGSRRGLIKDPTQVIYAEDLSQPLTTFGWSITGNVDVDSNNYKDVAVGAYKSNAAVLFKSRPLIRFNGTIHANEKSIKLPVPCSKGSDDSSNAGPIPLTIKYCGVYRALREPMEIAVKINLKFDSGNNYTKRAFELRTGQSIVERLLVLKKGVITCMDIEGYINTNIRDKTSNITFSADLDLVSFSPNLEMSPKPIIDTLYKENKPFSIALQKSCDICNPDLSLSVSTQTDFYVLGTDDKIDLVVRLTNSGEDSYLTSLNVTLPDDVSYINVLDIESCIPIACQQITLNGTGQNYLSCDIGNPFPKDQVSKFTIRMRVLDQHKINETQLNFSFNATSSYGSDLNPSDNTYNVVIPMKVDTSIYVTGSSHPADAVIYNDTHIASRRGPLVDHKFEIYTTGPSVIKTARVIIRWPIHSKDSKEYLLYLLQTPEILQGSAHCSVPERFLNPRNLSIADSSKHPYISQSKRLRRATPHEAFYSCDSGKINCMEISCSIDHLYKEKSVIIQVRSLVWLGNTFSNMSNNFTKEIVLSSTAVASVEDVPYKIKPASYPSHSFTVMSYFEKYRPTQVIKPLEWKWIVIGICIGLFLLIVIIVIFWRCGFFKRYRPHEAVKVEKHKEGKPHETVPLYSGYSIKS